jgi:hypothetical protein
LLQTLGTDLSLATRRNAWPGLFCVVAHSSDTRSRVSLSPRAALSGRRARQALGAALQCWSRWVPNRCPVHSTVGPCIGGVGVAEQRRQGRARYIAMSCPVQTSSASENPEFAKAARFSGMLM